MFFFQLFEILLAKAWRHAGEHVQQTVAVTLKLRARALFHNHASVMLAAHLSSFVLFRRFTCRSFGY